MIKIEQKDNVIIIKGHSLPNICAAVSSVVYTTANAILTHMEIGNKDGQCTFEDNLEDDFFKITIDKKDYFVDLLIENMFNSFYDICEQDKSHSCISIAREFKH